MKSKKMTYVLGLLVLVVWGMIIYRIFTSIADHDDSKTASTAQSTIKEPYNDYSATKDTGKLMLNYRNPFSAVAKDTVVLPKLKSLINPKNLPQTVVNWGFIKYSGFIRNPKSNKLIALMVVNGKNIMLAEGETAEDVKLLKNFKDSVKISYKNKTRFITMNNASL
ncbi:hypothetical protein [Mucilaginibacter boryungensis]|uniref:Type II secretion system (T2SS) protein C n=1 Tax=Mucilaginibacter boryungensis TaxID=768480 RepID=A0ABR9XM37_9SPHI|nr:hypothetical protein [Mucilaginibacter boryungensis]MBE9668272.1 hypothetical protein [Mucilaginibacter boryungensis]